MKTKLICALLGLGLAAPALQAQTAPATSTREARSNASFSAQMFYQILVAEMSAARGDLGAAVSLLLDAARKSGDAQLYQRAADLALGARAGDTALQVARSWRQAQPRSLEANRYVLQILVAMNRVSETAEPLKTLVELTPEAGRAELLDVLPALYGRASERKLAASVVEQALASALAQARTAPSAWAAVARLRATASDVTGALEAVERAQRAQASHVPAAIMAVDLMDKSRPQAELMVKRYLESATPPAPQVRLGYARSLLDLQRQRDSQTQLELLTSEHPDFPEGWLLLGSLQAESSRLAQAETSLKRYLTLSQPRASGNSRGMAQAQLMLAQVAEKRGDIAEAERWLAMVSNRDLLVQTQSRRASLLARQGKMQEARELIRKLPEQEPGDARLKLLAEVNLLREFKQFEPALELLTRAAAAAPQDTDVIYEQAMMAEKLGRLEQMEQLLRRAIQLKPDNAAAYNALGYSLADRGLRLPEAKQLIQKALEFAPNDPYIQDSLAWVEFRLGNKQEALRVIEIAYRAKPDAEIAAHFGEILWSLDQRDRARQLWREGMELNPENETLLETIKRLLQAKP